MLAFDAGSHLNQKMPSNIQHVIDCIESKYIFINEMETVLFLGVFFNPKMHSQEAQFTWQLSTYLSFRSNILNYLKGRSGKHIRSAHDEKLRGLIGQQVVLRPRMTG